MRLTLRTLLAYLDNILEPDDTQDIGKKIEESEYATGLVHRIRDVMRRLRLSAPNLTERNPKFDANNVAEYLDNTLASEEVTDFEKVCLESDVHLAEVGSCHQILTLVLGEPAEIDPASRDRIYQIKDTQASAGPPPTPAFDASRVVASAGGGPQLDLGQSDEEFATRKHRTRPTVPEYLREPRKRRHWLPAAAAVMLVACFTVVVLMALRQFEPTAPLGNALVQWGIIEGGKPSDEVAAVAKQRGEGRGARDEGPGEEAPMPEAVEPLTADSTVEPFEAPVIAPATERNGEARNGLSDVPDETVSMPPDAAVSIESPIRPEPDAESSETAVEAPVDATIAPAPENILTPDEEVAPLPPEPLGRLVSNEQVLLRNDTQRGWIRVAANQMLMPQRLLALPTYRNEIRLSIGVTLEVLGGTQIELLASGPQELPGIRVLYGRVVMMPLAQPGSRLRVAFGDRSGIVAFPDAESVAALEVRRLHVPGTNPEAGPPQVVADLYASTGSAVWGEIGGGGDGKTLRLTAPQRVRFNGELTSEPVASKALPPWIVAESIGDLDRRASKAIEQSLQTDRLARLGLLELATSRPQKEVRWLALRCLGYLGQYHDMVAALNDPAYKPYWPDYIDQLREGVARDAESAEAIRLGLEKQHPQQSVDLYRMLWGYTNDDLRAGADKNLVKALSDDSLAVRVLADWNLRDLTGGVGLFYRPEQTAAKRQQPIRRWNERLGAGEIRLKAPEEKSGASTEEKTPHP